MCMSVFNSWFYYPLFWQVYYWKQHKHNQHHMEKHILNFSGNHSRGMLPGLHPFSLYSFNVRVYNGKGEGPPSATQQFETPEGGEGCGGVRGGAGGCTSTSQWRPEPVS